MSYRSLSDSELRNRFTALVASDRRSTAQIVAHLEEIDRRELWAADGYSGLTKWCVDRYAMSESQAGKRVRAARLSRRFPVVLGMLERGEIHLGTLNVLGRHLTDENHRAVLSRGVHKTERELELLVAELAPKPDVRSRVAAVRPIAGLELGVAALPVARAVTPSAPAPVVKPLSPDRYKVQLTIDGATLDKLRELEDLMAHAVDPRDLAAIVDRAFDALLEKVRRERKAITKRPRSPKPTASIHSRVPSAEVTRAVWERDGNACAFVSSEGRRCASRRMLELHHVEPFAKGGPTTVENLELRCRAHNQHEAKRDYGAGFMARKRESARTASPKAYWRSSSSSSVSGARGSGNV